MKRKFHQQSLPVNEHKEKIIDSVRKHATTVLVGETGILH
jgi:HrpA-like RNA helicase